jgi:hypothetical protein
MTYFKREKIHLSEELFFIILRHKNWKKIETPQNKEKYLFLNSLHLGSWSIPCYFENSLDPSPIYHCERWSMVMGPPQLSPVSSEIPFKICSMGIRFPQDFVLLGIRPHRTLFIIIISESNCFWFHVKGVRALGVVESAILASQGCL